MTVRKPRIPAPPLPSKIKAVPYPPAAIWKNKEEGVRFEFRGNLFTRRGMHVIHVSGLDAAPPEAAKSKMDAK